MNKIIVFGDDFHNTYGVIRSLGEAGYRPYFIDVNCKSWSFVEKSRYIEKFWRVGSTDEGLAILRDEFFREEEKPVVICTSDPTIFAIDGHYDEFSNRYFLPHANHKQGEISRLMDKNIMRIYAEKVGFDLTHSVTVNPAKYNENELNGISYPCLVKPSNSLDGEKTDIRVCQSKESLIENLKELKNRNHSVEIQDYIKKDIELLLMGCVLNSGEVIMPIFLGKKREDPNLVGSTAWSECTPNYPDFDISKVQKFFDLINYRGIFSMEFLVKGEKKYFLEVNFRNDGNGYAPTYGGVNLPVIFVNDMVGNDVRTWPRKILRKFNSQVELTDFSYLKKHLFNCLGWFISTARTECYLVANKQDFEPFKEINRHRHFIIGKSFELFYKILVNAKN